VRACGKLPRNSAGEPPAGAPVELGLAAPVAEAGLEHPAERDRAAEPFDPAGELAEGCDAPAAGQRHRIGDANRALRGLEGGLEDVGVVLVGALDLVGDRRLEAEGAARSASSMRAKTDGESMFGRQSQSMAPSRATRAVVRPSPSNA